jgi:hypothetical protein
MTKRRPSVSVPIGYAAAWARLFARSPEELEEQAKASTAPQPPGTRKKT